MPRKKITSEGLEKRLEIAHEQIRLWVQYRDDLIEFNRAFAEGTTPPGSTPPKPPGIPKQP